MTDFKAGILAITVAFSVMVLTLTVGVANRNTLYDDQMKRCIASGASWIPTRGFSAVCITPNLQIRSLQ